MNSELIIRHVPNYGFLPIVRDYGTASSRPGKEYYRGEFYRTVEDAVRAGIRHLEEAIKCHA